MSKPLSATPPLTYIELREFLKATLGVSTATAGRRIIEMVSTGRILKTDVGYVVPGPQAAPIDVTTPPELKLKAPITLTPIPQEVLADPLNGRAAQLMDFFISRGASAEKSAYAVGNIMKRPKYSTGDVARAMDESIHTVRNLINSGLLRAHQWGKRWRIESDELQFYKTHGRKGLLERAGK